MQPVIHRSERICIDISDNVVSIIKLDPDGIMMRAGSAKAPTMPSTPNDAYVTDLSKAIRNAAWAAKVSTKLGASCVVVSGGPENVIQRFTWPDMPAEALDSVVREEMIPYLPGNPSHFTVSCEVLRRDESSGTPMLEVLAAAMPVEFSAAISTACRWANLKPKRVELRENARGRLAHYWCAPIEGVLPSTYAILDVGPGVANISFFHNSLFHSNRYFTPEMVKLDEVKDFDLLMTVKAGGVDDNENAMSYDPNRLTQEIISAINHFNRSISGDGISSILLMDEESIPGVDESLRAELNVLILKPSQWVTPGVKRPNLRRIEQTQFLDAFAAGMPSISGHESRMDLCMTKALTATSAPSAASPLAPPSSSSPAPVGSPQAGYGYGVTPVEPALAGYGSEVAPVKPATAGYGYDSAPIEPTPTGYGYDAPLKTGYVNLPDLPATAAPAQHEFPFDIVPAKKPDHSGFPYAMPEDPHPESSSKMPIFVAAAVAAAVLLIVVLASMFAPLPTPISTAREYQAELDVLEGQISALVTTDAMFLLNQERENMYRDISAIRWDNARAQEKMFIIRDFYLRPPALITIPYILFSADIEGIESIESSEHELTITSQLESHEIAAFGRAFIALRSYEIFADSTLTPNAHDITGRYEIVVNPRFGASPFWMHSGIERSFP